MSGSVVALIRSLNANVPLPQQLPTEENILEFESLVGFEFPEDFKNFLLYVSDVSYSVLSPVQITNPNAHNFFPDILESAREYGVPSGYIPFCEDNADFYCMNNEGEIFYWSSDSMDFNEEKWISIWDWIEQVWIGESK